VRAAIGRHIPHIYFFAPEWGQALNGQLFPVGPEMSLVWNSYISFCRLDAATFRHLRPQYVQAADRYVDDEAGEERHFSPGKGLAHHVFGAAIHGLAAIGDGDSLVEKTFRRVAVRYRADAYWSIFRGWSDHDGAPSNDYIMRALNFWRWRLDA